MNQNIRLVIPVAPAPVQSSDAQVTQRRISEKGIRLGVLDNSKGNADLPLVMIPHPLGGLSLEQVQGRALAAIPQVVELIQSVLK